jgi:cytidylate kinase
LADRLVLGIAGTLRSGKSSLADELATRLAIPLVSFGGYVREQARTRGIPLSRSNLQELGVQLIAELGWRSFVVRVLETVGDDSAQSMIVEGIRHRAALVTLTDLVGARSMVCIGVRTDVDTRLERLTQEERVSFSSVAQHSTEVEVEGLLHDSCDLIVNGSKPPQQLADEVIDWLQTTGRLA